MLFEGMASFEAVRGGISYNCPLFRAKKNPLKLSEEKC